MLIVNLYWFDVDFCFMLLEVSVNCYDVSPVVRTMLVMAADSDR